MVLILNNGALICFISFNNFNDRKYKESKIFKMIILWRWEKIWNLAEILKLFEKERKKKYAILIFCKDLGISFIKNK